MRIFYHLVVTLIVTFNSIELGSQSDRMTSDGLTAGTSPSGGSPHPRPPDSRNLHGTSRSKGPSSLLITFEQPEPHGDLKYEGFTYPPGFETIDRETGNFIPIEAGHPFLSLITENGYVLGQLNERLVFFGIFAEFDGKLHRFKIPISGGRPVLMHRAEVREFYNFRKFGKKG